MMNKCQCRGVCRCNHGKPIKIYKGSDQRIAIDCGTGLDGCCIEPEFVIGASMLIWCKCCNCEIDCFGLQFFDLNNREQCFFVIGHRRSEYLPTGTFRYQIKIQTQKERIISQYGDIVIS